MPPVFLCDAMLGGLARWLRAAGYRAEFDVHMQDGELVRRGSQEGKVILTSDSDVLDRYAVQQQIVRTVYIPRDLTPVEQLGHVLGALDLELRSPRCMECGGALEEVPKETIQEQLPPRVKQRFDAFFRCAECRKVYWRGTHWEDIREKLQWAAEKRNE